VTKPLPLSDFRAVRHILEEHEYASGGEEVPSSDLIEPSVWDHITHLPDDIAVRISNDHRSELKLLNTLSSDWTRSVGETPAYFTVQGSVRAALTWINAADAICSWTDLMAFFFQIAGRD
jgi:hypothetical protein